MIGQLCIICIGVLFVFGNPIRLQDTAHTWQSGSLFEGDIDMSEDELVSVFKQDNQAFLDEQDPSVMSNALRNQSLLWPNGRVPYVIDHAFSSSDKLLIKSAFRRIHSQTCVRFVEKEDADMNWVEMMPTLGCSSIVGRSIGGSSQRVSLGSGCLIIPTILHELMHVIGFHHEQTRADRDKYVQVMYGNIIPGMEYNFKKYSLKRIQHLNAPYDFASIMHYSRQAFSKNGKDTIRKQNESDPIAMGTSADFSLWDIEKINRLYKCQLGKPIVVGADCYSKELETVYESAGSQLRSIHGISLAECRVHCNENSLCRGFNFWQKWLQCSLRSQMDIESRLELAGFDAYIKRCDMRPGCYRLDAGSSYEAAFSLIRVVVDVGLSECRFRCDSEPTCAGFNFWSDARRCDLHSGMGHRRESGYFSAYLKEDC